MVNIFNYNSIYNFVLLKVMPTNWPATLAAQQGPLHYKVQILDPTILLTAFKTL